MSVLAALALPGADDPINVAQTIGFAVIAAQIVFAAIGVVTTRNVVHAAMWLVLVLAGSAALFVLLAAEFVAVTQVMVYIGAVVVLLGQAIGRWANYVNEELYGGPTDLPWGLRIENPPLEYAEYTHFHPLFLYESLWNLLTLGVLLYLWLNFRDRLKKGDFLLMYLVAYPTARFFLEFLRLEVAMAGGVNVSQVFSGLVAVLAAALLIYRHRDAIRTRLRPGQQTSEKPRRASQR